MQRNGEYSLYQNLLDAGCSAETAEQYESLAKTGEWSKLLRELEKQKKHLLSALHERQKQIDCLDFLVYDINKKHRGELKNEF